MDELFANYVDRHLNGVSDRKEDNILIYILKI